jgi:hypothetical protein
MAKTTAASTRAPRGTKTVAQAFFTAADEIPEDRRSDVVKAALALIRDQLKEAREKAKAAKAKQVGAKRPVSRKVAGRPKATAKTAEGGKVAPPTAPVEPMDEVGGF